MPPFAQKKRTIFHYRHHYALENIRISTQNRAIITSKAILKHALVKTTYLSHAEIC
jgi:hypothetical protein